MRIVLGFVGVIVVGLVVIIAIDSWPVAVPRAAAVSTLPLTYDTSVEQSAQRRQVLASPPVAQPSSEVASTSIDIWLNEFAGKKQLALFDELAWLREQLSLYPEVLLQAVELLRLPVEALSQHHSLGEPFSPAVEQRIAAMDVLMAVANDATYPEALRVTVRAALAALVEKVANQPGAHNVEYAEAYEALAALQVLDTSRAHKLYAQHRATLPGRFAVALDSTD